MNIPQQLALMSLVGVVFATILLESGRGGNRDIRGDIEALSLQVEALDVEFCETINQMHEFL